MRTLFLISLVFITLAAVVIWPQSDVIVSGWFYRPEKGFFLADLPAFDALHVIAHAGSRILALGFFLLTIIAFCQHRPVAGLRARGWLFLFLGLLIGPGLVANGVFKDHWGRARPREIVEFGGNEHFSPALTLSNQCDRNCSFVSGDGSFGFYLPAFAYVVPWPRTRRVFWSTMGFGGLFALSRLAVGAHFLSDSLYALFFTQAILAGLHSLMFGWKETRDRWRIWMFSGEKSTR